MFDNYLIINKNLIPATAEVLANEFYSAPLTKYIFPQDEARKKVLPLIFESLLNIYQETAVTFVTSENIEGTFSLIKDSNSPNTLSFYGALLKTIPNVLKTLANIDIFETTKRINAVSEKLKEVIEFIENKHNYIFISSIAVKNQEIETKFMEEMLEVLKSTSDSTSKPLLVETETEEMVEIYLKYNFTLEKEVSLDNGNVTICILAYYPS